MHNNFNLLRDYKFSPWLHSRAILWLLLWIQVCLDDDDVYAIAHPSAVILKEREERNKGIIINQCLIYINDCVRCRRNCPCAELYTHPAERARDILNEAHSKEFNCV